MEVKGTKTIANKRHLSYNIVNTIGGKHLKAPRRPNKSRKYNNNIFKNRNNRAKRLVLLDRCPSR